MAATINYFPTVSGGGVTSAVAGTGISVSGATGAVTITNSAAFTADTTIQLNNASASAVNAWRGVMALAVATAGSERSTVTTTLLNAGSTNVASVLDGAGWLGLGLAATANPIGFAAGRVGITLTASASNDCSIIMRMPTTTASLASIGNIYAYNGANAVVIMSCTNNTSTTDGAVSWNIGTGVPTVMTWTSAGIAMANQKTITYTNGSTTYSGATDTNTIIRNGNRLLIGTTSDHDVALFANGTGFLTGNGASSVKRIGFLGATAAAQQTGGSATAAGTYGATEQGMLQKAYDCLRTFGLLT